MHVALAEKRYSRLDGTGRHDVPSTATPLLPRTNGKARKQKYRLEVLSGDGAAANVVNVGGKGQLLITVDEDSKLNENDFVISELSAEDSITKKRLPLIDSNGCVSKNGIITKLSKPTKRQLRIDIMFRGFDDQAQVVYHAIAKPCKTNCVLACNEQYYAHGDFIKPTNIEKRVRRSLDTEEPRAFDLEEDVYPVRTRREIVLVDPLNEEYLKEARKAIINDDYSLSNTMKLYKKFQQAGRIPELKTQKTNTTLLTVRQCLTENLGCAFAIGLGVVQVIVLLILAIVLCYNAKLLFKHNHVRQLEESLITHEGQNVNRVADEHNVENALPDASK
uniref:ZP domain-containing protein n=1 Tax=Panagrellus redivivus TaxID=6233 RepID=A0A7E4V8T4_PANRE